MDQKRVKEDEAVILGKMGFSYKRIVRLTGLEKHQIARALRAYSVKLADYRDGGSPTAKWVEQNARRIAVTEVLAESAKIDALLASKHKH